MALQRSSVIIFYRISAYVERFRSKRASLPWLGCLAARVVMESVFEGLSGGRETIWIQRESGTGTDSMDSNQEAFINRQNSRVFTSPEKCRNYAEADHSCQHFQAGKKISLHPTVPFSPYNSILILVHLRNSIKKHCL